MARVLLAEGKAGEAEAEARAAEELLRTLGATDRSAAALTVEGEALLAQGKLKEAAAAVRAAVDRARTSGGRLLGLEVQVAAASATVRTGTPEERAAALRQLEALRKDATGKGLKLLALEARLVAAQGFLAAGDTRVEADLKALIVEAKSKELGFLRRQAEELLGRLPGGAAGKS